MIQGHVPASSLRAGAFIMIVNLNTMIGKNVKWNFVRGTVVGYTVTDDNRVLFSVLDVTGKLWQEVDPKRETVKFSEPYGHNDR